MLLVILIRQHAFNVQVVTIYIMASVIKHARVQQYLTQHLNLAFNLLFLHQAVQAKVVLQVVVILAYQIIQIIPT